MTSLKFKVSGSGPLGTAVDKWNLGGAHIPAQAQVAQPPLVILAITPFSPQSTQTRLFGAGSVYGFANQLPLPAFSSTSTSNESQSLQITTIEIERTRERQEHQTLCSTDAAFESAAIKNTPIPSYYEQTFATYTIYIVLRISLDPASDEPRPHPPTTSHTTSITTPTPSKATTVHCDHDNFLPSSLLQLRSPRLNLVAPLPLLFVAIGQQDLTLSSLRRQTNPSQSAGQQGREQKKKASRRLPPLSAHHSTPPPPADESSGAQPPAKPVSSLNTNARARLRQTALELRALCANSIHNDTSQNQSESVPADRPGHPSWAAAQRTYTQTPHTLFPPKKIHANPLPVPVTPGLSPQSSYPKSTFPWLARHRQVLSPHQHPKRPSATTVTLSLPPRVTHCTVRIHGRPAPRRPLTLRSPFAL
ncbi:hypothetical protein CCUS01_07137 [Colletotrichum cuscutae]|uniref:Uncharacterized protein n=1 Tax=Colletotrichum cuscutae TaxID=1209917 RepID=A0AAI9V1C7_9PEZI|nr:hypothetical protein CCUS01_07137 [Colletotrichum cuscutae]